MSYLLDVNVLLASRWETHARRDEMLIKIQTVL